MPSFVYVLGCRTPDRVVTYVGWTTDVPRRLAQHNGGTGARTTRGRAWILLHTEKFRTRRQAMSREWHLKRDRKFRKLLAQGCQKSGCGICKEPAEPKGEASVSAEAGTRRRRVVMLQS